MAKHTLNGTRRKVIKTSGFRARLSTKSGRKIFKKIVDVVDAGN
jgi:large subunit ribosomal protein L34